MARTPPVTLSLIGEAIFATSGAAEGTRPVHACHARRSLAWLTTPGSRHASTCFLIVRMAWRPDQVMMRASGRHAMGEPAPMAPISP